MMSVGFMKDIGEENIKQLSFSSVFCANRKAQDKASVDSMHQLAPDAGAGGGTGQTGDGTAGRSCLGPQGFCDGRNRA